MTRSIVSGINALLGSVYVEDDENLLAILESVHHNGPQKFLYEKDFYLTVLLHRLAKELPELSFKGGTCLNKCYFPYFRLSEDLDFSIDINHPSVNSNMKREQFAHTVREKMIYASNTLGWKLNPDSEHHKKALGNPSLKNKVYTYLKYMFTYQSIYDGSSQTIKMEITYTHKQHHISVKNEIHDTFENPFTSKLIFASYAIMTYSLEEMLAEKMRAAITRHTPAIRDFYDIRYVKNHGFDFESVRELIYEKIDEAGGLVTINTPEVYDKLTKQVEIDLMPVVLSLDDFNLQEIYSFVLTFIR